MKFNILISGIIISIILDFSGSSWGVPVQSAPKRQTSKSASTQTRIQRTVGVAAKLTTAQIEQLVSLDQNNSKGVSARIVLPTYIPTGFHVDIFRVSDDTRYGIGARYDILYRNSSNSCFSISGGFALPTGGSPADYKTVEVSSPALGKIILVYLEFERTNQTSFIAFQNNQVVKYRLHGYSFYSPAPYDIARQNCSSISLQEAIKIVGSFQYLNP
ncbi:MAG TPA: hypothetical protein VK203_14420 [Nostocaceae cyanobacterium]|nr:hypothetical protein [Nostocaceae cyanobacterium]